MHDNQMRRPNNTLSALFSDVWAATNRLRRYQSHTIQVHHEPREWHRATNGTWDCHHEDTDEMDARRIVCTQCGAQGQVYTMEEFAGFDEDGRPEVSHHKEVDWIV